jgi:lycopene beta-cyclase
MDVDVLVVGGGPSGRALAAECGARGLRTTLLDPSPDAPWRATYGSWSTELPADVPAAARARGIAVALSAWDLGREYTVIDVPALRRTLDARLASGGVQVRAGRAVAMAGPGVVGLADGKLVAARVIVDAAGRRQPLRADGKRRVAAEQTAYGVVVDDQSAAPLVEPGTALFMDWRPDHGEPGWPTFLYAVPLGGGAVLLEETSLARRPGLPMAMLRRRLLARLTRHGITPPADARAERVRFPVDSPRHRTRGVLGFGAAAPLVHPASGFSVASSLRLAPSVADAIAAGKDPNRVVWPLRARVVHRLRRIGLEALLRMPPQDVPGFFEVFFGLPARARWGYLDGRVDLAGMLAAMRGLFGRADWRLRRRLVGSAFRRPAPPVPGDPDPNG